jgi:hypothetical protein
VCCPALPNRQWLEEKARNRSLEEALANNAVYEIEVKTGKMKVRVHAVHCMTYT